VSIYCCNRAEKKLKDGSVIKIGEYPWLESDDVLVNETCPWISTKPVRTLPFYQKYNTHIHRLVNLSRS